VAHQSHALRAPRLAGRSGDAPFANGDAIVQIDDVPIDNYAQINRQLAQNTTRKIDVTVERSLRNADGKPTGENQRLTIL